MCSIAAALIYLLQMVIVSAHSTGAPIDACQRMQPDHNGTFPKTADGLSTNPFTLVLSTNSLKQGDTLTVTLSSKDGTSEFKGFLLAAVQQGDASIQIGTFSEAPEDANWQNGPCLINNDLSQKASVTHKDTTAKKELEFTWQAPTDTTIKGKFCMQGAVVVEYLEWYKLDGNNFDHCFTLEEHPDLINQQLQGGSTSDPNLGPKQKTPGSKSNQVAAIISLLAITLLLTIIL